MLFLLLDEQISPQVASQIGRKRPEIAIISIQFWQEGRFLSQPDERILTAAALEELTLVTYDQKTIMPLLVQWGLNNTNHAGVIFIDNFTIAPSDFGTLVRSLIALWDGSQEQAWTNSVTYLSAD